MLCVASRLGNIEKVKELISSGSHLESCDRVRDTLPLPAHVLTCIYAIVCVIKLMFN